jgi:hypothetical protein
MILVFDVMKIICCLNADKEAGMELDSALAMYKF